MKQSRILYEGKGRHMALSPRQEAAAVVLRELLNGPPRHIVVRGPSEAGKTYLCEYLKENEFPGIVLEDELPHSRIIQEHLAAKHDAPMSPHIMLIQRIFSVVLRYSDRLFCWIAKQSPKQTRVWLLRSFWF